MLFKILWMSAISCTIPLFANSDLGVDGDVGNADSSNTTKKFMVGTKESPPFAFRRSDGSWTGISIELWRKIAAELELDFEFRELKSTADIVNQVESGELDAGIAAISITAERDARIDFSHSYYSTGLGVAVARNSNGSVWRFARNLMTPRFLQTIGILALSAVLAGLFFWKLEHKKNQGLFGGGPKQGVSMGIWWSTIMLLGHKGVMPATGLARFLALAVMIASTIAVSVLTGVIASAITVAEIGNSVSHPDDLRHMRIATIASTTSVEYLHDRHLRFEEFPTIELALQKLAGGSIEAVVYDIAMLKYQRNNVFDGRIEVLPLRFNEQQYGIALKSGNEIREPLNQALLKFTGGDDWSDVLYRYFGE